MTLICCKSVGENIKGNLFFFFFGLENLFPVNLTHSGSVVLIRSTPCAPDRTFRPTRAEPDQSDTGKSTFLPRGTGLLTSGHPVGSLGHRSPQLKLQTDATKYKIVTDFRDFLFFFYHF